MPRHYIGITGNIERRLEKHNTAGVQSTKAYRPWRLVYLEEHIDKKSARTRELFLKRTAKARQEIFDKK